MIANLAISSYRRSKSGRCVVPVFLSLLMSLSLTGSAADVTNGIVVWLKADAGVVTNTAGSVTNWQDQSGNKYDFWQTNAASMPTNRMPQISTNSGKPVVYFQDSAAVSNHLQASSTLGSWGSQSGTQGWSLVVVMAMTNKTTDQTLWGGSYRHPTQWGGISLNTKSFGVTGDATDYIQSFWAGDGKGQNDIYAQATNLTDGSLHVLTFLMVPTNASSCKMYMGGQQLSVTVDETPSSTITNLDWTANAEMCTWILYHNVGFRGDIAEFRLYLGVLSDSDRQNIEAALKDKWLPEFQQPPVLATIDNDSGASAITVSSATLNGNLTSTGGAATTVYCLWGDNDGGSAWGNWDNTNDLGVMAAGAVTNPVSGLNAGTQYYYTFAATNSAGTGWAPAVTNFWTVPDAPVVSAASSIQATSFYANWSAATGATNYLLDVATDSDFNNMVAGYNALAAGNVATYQVTGLIAGSNYYYRLRSQNSGGTSTNSAVVGPVTTLTLFEAWQIQYFGATNAANGLAVDDWDTDGANNYQEYVADTDPTNKASVLKFTLQTRESNGVKVYWNSRTSREYSVHRSTNLVEGWLGDPMATNLLGDVSGTTSCTDTDALGNAVQYQIRTKMPQ